MTPRVNLLPQSYRRALSRHRRARRGLVIGAALLGAELFAGLALHTRAGRTRELLEAAQTDRRAAALVKKKMAGPGRESEQLARQLTLARRLRTTHHWSRLLAALSQAASPRVMLTAVSTDPPRWAANLDPDARVGAPAKAAGGPSFLQGVTLRGYAADYEELSRFVGGLQAINAFVSLNLLEARRDRYLEQDVISFELQCRW